MPETEDAAADTAEASKSPPSTPENSAAAPGAEGSRAPETAVARAPEISPSLLDPDAMKVVRHLRRSGFKAYLVGGCVRDLLLGQRPKDFDVATSAHPHQVKETFKNSRLIGRRFRLAHVYFRGGKVIEVSTFRSNPLDALVDEGELKQDLLIRHDNVFGNEEEDVRRRDFTINGLFYDPEAGRVVDHVGGVADLAARLVRTIGNPDVRMREDPVRILRAIRFAAKCDLALEPETLAAMKAHVQEIPRCAPPRVLEELLKLTRCGAARRCLELMRDVGVLKTLLAPIDAAFQSNPDALERQLRALDALDAHVRVDEVPSDAVLLSALLAPLPRSDALGPIPKVAHPAIAEAAQISGIEGAASEAEGATASDEESDEIEPELEALGRRLAEEGADESAGDDEASDDETDASEIDSAEGALDPEENSAESGAENDAESTARRGARSGEDARPPKQAAEEDADNSAKAAARSTGQSVGSSSEAERAEPEREHASAEHAGAESVAVDKISPAEADAAVRAPLPSAALRSLNELHDERLAASGIPTFSIGGESAPWSLPRGVVPPETVLSEMVRTARLPRRIAERARLILSVQGILSGERKRRRFSAAQFARESIFPEALAIFELNTAATGKGQEQLARWQAIFLGQPVAELQVEAPRDAERSRRRRRGGRGRRGGGRSS